MTQNSENDDMLDMDISYDMKRLFDQYNFDHIPEKKRLKFFKQRDLSRVKFYKVAVKIFGGPSSRTRALIAPPMETPFKHRLGLYLNEFKLPSPPVINGSLKTPPEKVKQQTQEEIAQNAEQKHEADYHNIIAKRKQLRKDLDCLTLNEAYLARKTDKSELEKRVEAKYRTDRLWKPQLNPPPETVPSPKPLPDIPTMAIPPPDGLQILDKFLSLNHMRLMDLFLSADKDKRWSLSRQKLLNAVTQAEIPLIESEVDALIVTLDTDLDDELSYQELNKGLQLWRKQRRIIKNHEELEAEKNLFIDESTSKGVTRDHSSDVATANSELSREHPFSVVNTSENLSFVSQNDRYLCDDKVHKPQDIASPTVTVQNSEGEELIKTVERKETPSKEIRSGSNKASTHSRTSTPNSLEPPEPDFRKKSWRPASMEEEVDIRKHDRVVVSRNKIRRHLTPEKRAAFDELPGVIKIGFKPIDDHCSESTLGGETADMINQFRREKLKEYFNVKKIFEQKGLKFTQETLDKVLLYPGDKPTSELKRSVVMSIIPLTDEPESLIRRKTVHGQSGQLYRTLGVGSSNGKDRRRDFGGAYSGRNKKFSNLRMREGDHKNRRRMTSPNYVTVEDVYPLAANVAPKVYNKNLSSGRALISRKVDSWMTFEEYSNYTQNLPKRFHHFNKKSNPDASWPGYLLNKIRLFMDSDLILVDGQGRTLENRESRAYEGYGTGIYNGRGNALFFHTAQSKRTNPGYNNDLLTWPVGENGVKYGNIDEHRLVK